MCTGFPDKGSAGVGSGTDRDPEAVGSEPLLVAQDSRDVASGSFGRRGLLGHFALLRNIQHFPRLANPSLTLRNPIPPQMGLCGC